MEDAAILNARLQTKKRGIFKYEIDFVSQSSMGEDEHNLQSQRCFRIPLR
jgi:hypothetical protein